MMKINYSNADKADINDLKELWLSSFDEKPTAVDLFFDNCFSPKQTYIAMYGDKIVSALYLLPTSFKGQKAHYLCGASTHKDFRKKGIMSELISFALKNSANNGDKYSFLFPANDKLYSYYQKLGYIENCSAYISEFTREDLIYFGELNSANDNILNWNNNFKRFSADYYSIYDIKSINNENYFALLEESENTAEVFYFDYKENYFKQLINEILHKTNAEHFVFTHNGIFKNAQKIRCGMVKPLKNVIATSTDIYIGITLN